LLPHLRAGTMPAQQEGYGMPTMQVPGQLRVEQLRAAATPRSPGALREFIQHRAAWQQQDGQQAEEAALSSSACLRIGGRQRRLPISGTKFTLASTPQHLR